MENDRTTINIDKAVREELHKIKNYKRETYDEVLGRLIANDRKRLKK